MISILDSGMGGKCFYDAMPFAAHLILDNKNFPYGNKDLDWLKDHFVKLIEEIDSPTIIVACNTLSSLIFYYHLNFNKQVVDVITPTIFYIRKQKFAKILILATKNTIKMNIYGKLLDQKVIYYDASELIDNIEHNRTCELDFVKEQGQQVDAILLGCTHLIRLKEALREKVLIPIIAQDEIMLNWFN